MSGALLARSRELSRELSELRFPEPVAYVYDPTSYAAEPHRLYFERWVRRPRVLLLGMNPGPWGMVQTGVPFGAVPPVRDWLGIEASVGRPPREHPKKPVRGFACPRVEVSGDRLWGWAREGWGSPERFFEEIFVLNYCPLLFLDEGGRNLTPDRIPVAVRDELTAHCDRALRDAVAALGVELAVGVGVWAERRLHEALGSEGPAIGRILHPSPASPAANRGWARTATAQLAELGVVGPG